MDRQLRRLQGSGQLITRAGPATDVPSGHGAVRSRPVCRRWGGCPQPSTGRFDYDGRDFPLRAPAPVTRDAC